MHAPISISVCAAAAAVSRHKEGGGAAASCCGEAPRTLAAMRLGSGERRGGRLITHGSATQQRVPLAISVFHIWFHFLLIIRYCFLKIVVMLGEYSIVSSPNPRCNPRSHVIAFTQSIRARSHKRRRRGLVIVVVAVVHRLRHRRRAHTRAGVSVSARVSRVHGGEERSATQR